MAKPTTGWLGYDEAFDRPTVKLQVGTRRLLTEDDLAGGGSVTEVDSPDGSIVVTNGTGPTVSVEANFGTGAGEVMEGNQAAGGDASGTLDNLTIADLRIPDSEFWAPPASPHSDDIEFTSGSIPSGWAYANGTDGTTPTIVGTPDITSSLSTTDQIRVDYNVKRSWWRIQVPKDGKRYCFFRALPAVTDYTIRGRVRAQTLEHNNGSRMGIFIASDNGGLPDLRTGSSGIGVGYLMAGWQASTSPFGAECPCKIQRVNGSNADVFTAFAASNLLPYMDFEIVIVRSSSSFTAYLLHNGYTTPIASGTAALTVAYYGFWIENTVSGSAVARILGGDYSRFEATANPIL